MKKIRQAAFLLITLLMFTNMAMSQTTIIQDNLAGSTLGAQVGGSFSAEGYKPGVGSGHILYDVPGQVVNGYVEFQFKGFSHTALPADADNGFVGLYDGRGIAEPIQYFNDFKENFFRWNFHWRQNRANVKGLISCAEPVADRLNATKAVYTLANSPEDPNFPGQPERDWSSEPNGSGWSWDVNTWYTLKIEWNNKSFSAKINGTTVWSTSGPYDYAPIDFKIWLGSAPGYGIKYTNSLPNLVYRNFKLVSYGAAQNSAPVITSSAVTNGAVGQLYSYDVGASGNPAPTYSLTTFPSGMTINSSNGLIQWTPSAAGNVNVTVKAANGVNPDATQSFTINVQGLQNTPPVITSTAVTNGTVGQLYSYDVNATGNPVPTFSLTTFPSGMTINSTSGLIQWTPTTTGNVNVTVKAANGINPDATQSFTINVQEPGVEIIVLQDNLQGSTLGSQIGGSFSAEGYKPGVGNNHILYDVPGQVVNGYIEFQIKGFSHSLVQDPEGDAENAFAGLYDGRGIVEPIEYFDDFKENFFRWNLHWRQNRAAFKFTINCAAPTSERLNAVKSVFTGAVDWTSAPTGSGWNWDANTWYTVKMEWNSKSFKVLVNGTQVASTSGPYDYAPIDFRIWLGSAPGPSLQNTVQNIVYRNFKLVNYNGSSQTTAPVITSTAVTNGTVGQLYSYDVNATGNPAPTFSLTTFPSGMTINSTSGLIQWTPTTTGNVNVTVKAANGVSPDATQSFTINVQVAGGEVVVLQDNLQGSTLGSQIGGSFSAEGYKPGVGNNHILYDVPGQVVNGYIEFQVKGFAHSLVPAGSENGFAGLYDGRGIAEPIQYFNNFKENFFRWSFFWKQSTAIFKAAMNCAEPTASRLNATTAVYTLSNSPEDPQYPGQPLRDWTSDPNGSGWSWNESTWYTIRIEWNNKSFSAKIDGTTIWSTSGPYDYAPIDFKIWLGSAPGSGLKYTNSVQNIVYRNFKLVNYNGSPQTTAPVITSTAVTNGTVGQLYSYDVNATGNPAPTYSLTTFPSGMTINSSSGLIQWTPSVSGNVNVTVRAANGVSPDATQSFTINVQAASSCPSGIISYWKLDETSGSNYSDYIGSNNATSPNTPTPAAGRVNGSQRFDGTSDRILVPRIAAYDFSANSSFTFEAWINHPAGSYIDRDFIISRKTSESMLSIFLGFEPTSNITFSVRSTAGEARSVTGTSNLYDGQWHHVVGVKDGSTNQLRVYVDGSLQNTAPASYTSGFGSPSAAVSIGWRDIGGGESYFNGSIDEVAIYNTALDAATISQHYNNGLQNNGYCQGQLAADESNIKNNFGLLEKQVYGESIKLNWSTVQSPKGGRFVVERSIAELNDQNDWQYVGEIYLANTNESNAFLFTDKPNTVGKYTYRVKYLNSGSEIYSNKIEAEILPSEYALFQNYPNPFNPSTTIRFAVPIYSKVLIQIYNQLGETVAVPINDFFEPGNFEVDVKMDGFASGIYFYKISAGTFSDVKKMILAK